MRRCVSAIAILLAAAAVVGVGVWWYERRKAEGGCHQRNQWGGNACNLRGSLDIFSNPSLLPVTRDHCNLFYRKEEFILQPLVLLPDAKQGESYTVIMLDPDAGANYTDGIYYLHWIASNIRGVDIQEGYLNDATVITPYFQPSPWQNSSIHHYTFLAYRQTTTLNQTVTDAGRLLFDLASWVLKSKLCGPVSGRQFRTNYSGQENATTSTS